MSERKCVRSRSRNVAGLIPDSGPRISSRHSPSDLSMVLDSTHAITETQQVRGLAALTQTCAVFLKMLKLHFSGSLRACPGLHRPLNV